MPPIDEPTPDSLDRAQAEWERFYDAAAWRPSRNNRANVWRDWEGNRLTVFLNKGSYGWSIHDGSEVRYSWRRYDSDEEAMTALGMELGVGR